MKAEPSRTWSIIVTFFGDAIVPRGGSVWLGTLLELFEALGINAPVVRTAVSRLTTDDWLDRTRLGRNSFYRLSGRGASEFEQAAKRVYAGAGPNSGASELSFALLKAEGDKDAAREDLKRSGYAQVSGDLWMSVNGVAPPSANAICFSGHATREDGWALARICWPVGELAARYAEFLRAFSALDENLKHHHDVLPRNAIIARTLLIHEFRRIVLRDPILPEAILPPDWPGREAAALCRRLYGKLLPASEAWLDTHGRCAGGLLPPASGMLASRFGLAPSTYNKNN
ncbi:MAG: PaaX family transcriptional regulator C-terminal domain-containing protein [Beijerinckiaceae bacterium]|nr:PaaX family transcriptional regulator C-terminal domain-containing protein [Beijerinckiaceae bacterium]